MSKEVPSLPPVDEVKTCSGPNEVLHSAQVGDRVELPALQVALILSSLCQTNSELCNGKAPKRHRSSHVWLKLRACTKEGNFEKSKPQE